LVTTTAISIMPMGSTEADLDTEIKDFMGGHLPMRRQEHTPVRSADSITAETPRAFLLAGSRALEATVAALAPAAAFMAVAASMAEAEGTGDRLHRHLEFVTIQEWRECHAA